MTPIAEGGAAREASFRLGLALVAAAAAAAVLWISANGIGLSPDSALYIAAARSLADGRGVLALARSGEMAPMTIYPPAFPALLAAFGLAGIDALEAARWLNAGLLGVNGALAALIVRRTSGSRAAGLIAGAMLAVSLPMVSTHAMAWSEPTYFAFALLGFLLLDAHFEHGRIATLVAAACALALAWMTRYVGIAAVASATLGVLMFAEPGRRAWRSASLFAVVAAAPMAAWVVRNSSIPGSFTSRERGFHPPTGSDLQTARAAVAAWVSPLGPSGAAAFAALAALLFVALARRGHDGHTPRRAPIVWVLAIFGAAHLVVVASSRTFSYANIPFDTRILSPAYLAILVAVAAAAARSAARSRSALPAVALAVAALTFAGAHALASFAFAVSAHARGQGFDAPAWQRSDLMTFVGGLPRDTVVFTNADDAIYLVTGRMTRRVPDLIDQMSLRENSEFEGEIEAMRAALAGGGLVVYFDRLNWRWYLPPEPRLREILGLEVVRRDAEGTVLELPSGAARS